MAKNNPEDKIILPILKYSTSYPYFGELRFSNLYDAQRDLRRCVFYDTPKSSNPVYIGKIDGNIICGALWRLMGYNPGRFGTVNPFQHNGRNSIFHFVREYDVSHNAVLAQLRAVLCDFLAANARDNGQWNDEIPTNHNGYVNTILADGHTGSMYKRLCMLRDAVQIITKQNVSDFRDKRGPYRAKIIDAVRARHPDRFQELKPEPVQSQKIVSNENIPPRVVAPAIRPDSDVIQELDRIMEKMDNVQITLDNRANVSTELYEQACAEMSELMSAMHDIYKQYSM